MGAPVQALVQACPPASALRTWLPCAPFFFSEGEGKIKGMLRGSRLSRLQRCSRRSLFLPAQRPNRAHSAASVAVRARLTSPLSGIQALIQTQINKSTHGEGERWWCWGSRSFRRPLVASRPRSRGMADQKRVVSGRPGRGDQRQRGANYTVKPG